MKAPPAPYGALALATGLLIVLVGAALSPLTSLGRRLRAEPLSLPTETAPATIPEPSGAAYHPARGTILVVSDEGGLVELTPGGAPLDRFDIPGDLEAVAVHPQTGTVFLGLERAETILEYDLDTRQTIRQLRLDLSSWPGFPPHHSLNQEIEGLCIVKRPDGSCRLLMAWESRPARVASLDADLSPAATDSARQACAGDSQPLRHPVRIEEAFAVGPRQLSELTYDAPSQLLLVLSADDRTMSVCDLSGQVLTTYRLDLSKPEGLCLLPNGDAVMTQEDEHKLCFYRGLRQILPARSTNTP